MILVGHGRMGACALNIMGVDAGWKLEFGVRAIESFHGKRGFIS